MTTKPRSILRRIERGLLGLVMGVAAFIIERRVLKSIKKKGGEPPRQTPELAEEATSELGSTWS